MSIERKKILDIAGFISFVGALATIYPALSDPKLYAIVAMLITCAFCLFLASNYYDRFKKSRVKLSELEIELIEKESVVKESNEVVEELSALVYRVHQNIDKIHHSDDVDDLEHIYSFSLRQVLNSSTSIFNIVTSQKCSSSLMLRDNSGMYKSEMYCSNAKPKRETEESRPLGLNEGYVGRAFTHKRPQLWNIGDVGVFLPTRDNFDQYYTTGISVPIFCNDEPRAVLNIDSKVVGAFSDGMFHLAETISHALAILLAYHDEILASGFDQEDSKSMQSTADALAD